MNTTAHHHPSSDAPPSPEREPVAIVGIGCRYPQAESPADLWRLLINGENAVGEIPPGRLGDLDRLFDPRPGTRGKMMTRFGGFLNDIEYFDADFFGIAPLEAERLDPQQRILLEVAWEAFEDAGIPPGKLVGSSTGVFIGSWAQDFEARLVGDPLAGGLRGVDVYTTTGSGRYPLAGRLSYHFGLQGPSLVLDTACSSSLVAVHLACRSLQNRECDLALAGGVNIMLTPYITVAYSQARMMAPDGRCKFGDARADGYVRSEGCGIVVLKPLSRALADRDAIYAVIYGGAVTNDGRTSVNLPTPGVGGQEDALRKAYRDAGIAPGRVHYVEAHGTGTVAGDPVELEALGNVLSENRPAGQPCLVGSIKTNLGHTEGAAGVAGLIKAALAINHRQIPASLHLVEPNPKIPWERLAIEIPTRNRPWPSDRGPLVAGVNSFGITGTNAHLVIGEAPATEPASVQGRPAPGVMADKWLLPLSARSEEALRAMARRVQAAIAVPDALEMADLCATAALKREHHEYRVALVAANPTQLRAGLTALAGGESAPGVVHSGERIRPLGKLAFVYPGQGSQWLGMGRQLMRCAPAFRAAIERCDQALKPLVDWSLREQLEAPEESSRLDDISVVQPVLFAIQVALTAQWQAWGVRPDAVVGHSMGEPAAAHAAGVLDLDTATRIIVARSRLMKRTSGRGAMAVVELTMAQAAVELQGREASLSIAVSNSPRSTVISGDPAALDQLLAELEGRQVFCRRIKVDVASHSPQMEPLRGELVAALDGLAPQPGTVPVYSTVTGGLLGGEAFQSGYWGDNLRRPVRFAEAVARMLADGHTIFIEMSPHPILLRAIDECIQAQAVQGAAPCATLPSLLRQEDEAGTLLESLGRLYVLGHPVDWRGLYSEPGGRAAWPTYPWQRERHWFEEPNRPRSRRHALLGDDGRRYHALLEHRISASVHRDLHLWESDLDMRRLPWLRDHTVQGHPVFPAAAFIEAAAAAAEEIMQAAVELRDLEFQEALFPDTKVPKRFQVVMQKGRQGGSDIRLLSRPGDADAPGRPWREHARGTVAPVPEGKPRPAFDIEGLRGRCRQVVDGDRHYREMQRCKIVYGEAFRNIERIGVGDGEAIARIRAPQAIAADAHDFRIHPALLDAVLQLLVNLAKGGVDEGASDSATWLPVRLETARVFGPPPPGDVLWGVCTLGPRPEGRDDRFAGDLLLLDASGRTVFEARRVELRRIGHTLADDVDQWLYTLAWTPKPLADLDDEHHRGLPAPGEIEQRVAAAPLPERLGSDAETARQVLPLFEDLSVAYILHALASLGMAAQAAGPARTDDPAGRLPVQGRHRRLLDRLLLFLREEGIALPGDDGWRVPQPVDASVLREKEDRLRSRYPQCQTELALLMRCGRHLAEALSGAVEPLELIFPGGSLEEAEAFYGDSIFARTANHHAALALAAAIADLPEGRTVRILELGAGTGGLTRHLIDRLPAGRATYRFTDIGAAFVTRAQQKYNDLPWMEFAVLDIENDPASQGFAPHSFDVVLAANCLHATRDMESTLANVRTLMAPGGLMLLVEGTRPQRWVDLVFGLTEGWWRFADFQRRPSHPLLDGAAWKDLTAACGFAETAVVHGAGAALFEQSVVMARAPATAATPHAQAPGGGDWLIFADRGGCGEALAQALRRRGDRCHLIPSRGEDADGGVAEERFDPADPTHFERALQQLDSERQSLRRGVVFMWPLDETGETPASADALRQSQAALCGGLLHLVQALAGREGERRTRLWVATRQALPTGRTHSALSLKTASLAGLVRVIDLEHPELHCRGVDLDGASGAGWEHLLNELDAGDDEALVAYRGGQRLAPRMIRLSDRAQVDAEWQHLPAGKPMRLVNHQRGTLDELKFQPIAFAPPGAGEVAVQVRAAGLNFRDVACALGLIADDDDPGLECAGRIVAVGTGVQDLAVGDDVLVAAPGSFATFVGTKAAMVAPMPEGMTYEQAATIPIAFLTAYHALVGLADLQEGERVLIHAASGGVGLAAVQIAKARGAEVFGTAGTPRKRAYLSSLGVEHVLDSRSLDFAAHIEALTAGAGVDVVLNSLSGNFIDRSFAVLRHGGRFVEIGKRDIWTPEKARRSRPDAFYAFFDLAGMIADEPMRVRPMLDRILSQFRSGELKPLPAMIFPMEQIVGAYRTMQQAGHIGKIVATLPPWSGDRTIDAPEAFRPDATYLITGAFGGIGMGLAQWLFDRGARHLALVGRRKPPATVAARIADLEAAGVRVRVIACDVASEGQVEHLFSKDLANMPPLRGVFHLAGALDDGALIQQSWPRFETVFAPKVLGAWNLHCLTERIPLDCFVLFSSWSSFLGSPGQANHSAANAFLDALAFQRRANGRPGLSINWGAWAEIGAATKGDAAAHLARRGIGSFSPVMGFRALGQLMGQGSTQVAVMPFDLPLWRASSPAAARSPWFERLAVEDADTPEDSVRQAEPAASLLETLRTAPSDSVQRQALGAFLKSQVAQTLRLPLARIEADKPFKSYGMDSLTALEFRNRIEAATGTTLSATLVFNYPNIQQLEAFLLEKLQEHLMPPSGGQAAEPGGDSADDELSALLDEVEKLSEEQTRRLLNDER